MEIIKYKEKWEKTKKEIIEEIKDKWSWFYVLGMIFFTVLLRIKINSPTLKIISLIGLVIVQLVYNLKVKSKDSQWLKWVLFSILVLLSVNYISTISEEFRITGFSSIIILGITFVSVTIAQFKNLWKSKSIPKIIFEYVVFALIIILFFGFIYSILSALPNNQITDKENKSIEGIWNFVYFSSSVFYTNVIEYYPHGYSKLITQLELAVSFILHIILLGNIVNNLNLKKR